MCARVQVQLILEKPEILGRENVRGMSRSRSHRKAGEKSRVLPSRKIEIRPLIINKLDEQVGMKDEVL